MSFTLIAYLMAIVPKIEDSSFLIAIFSGVVALFLSVILFDVHNETEKKTLSRARKLMSICFFVSLIAFTITPDEKGLRWIVGAYVADATIESVSKIEGVDKLPANVVNAMNAFLEDIAAGGEVEK